MKEHKCPQDLGRLVIGLVPVVFNSLLKERPTRKQITEELKRYSDVSEDELNLFASEVHSIDSEETRLREELLEYGRDRDKIVDRLARQTASCKRCAYVYRRALLKSVESGLYRSVSEADEDLFGLFWGK